MTTAEIGLCAIFCYAAAFIFQLAWIGKSRYQAILSLFIILALITHGLQLHRLIDLPSGQNLSLVNLFSLLTWLSALLIALVNLRLPVRSLNFLLYPVAIMSIGLSVLFPASLIIPTQHDPVTLFHILLSTLIVALFVMSGIQALLLSVQQYALKQKKLLSVLQIFPALDQMEKLLFFDLALSFIGLSLFLISAFMSFSLSVMIHFWQESIASLLLWFIVGFLLLGRYCLRWRSATAAVWTSLAVAIAITIFLTRHLN